MRWVRDTTGRFLERPHYDVEEMDDQCESIISAFMHKKYGEVRYPITTNDLVILLEQETSDVDHYAELDDDVEGVTHFLHDRLPTVQIATHLTTDARREVRLRTTLTHELGHVKLHRFLWSFGQLSLFDVTPRPPTCNRDSVHGFTNTDWMEWQARFASGAFLMPITALRRTVQDVRDGLSWPFGSSARASSGQSPGHHPWTQEVHS